MWSEQPPRQPVSAQHPTIPWHCPQHRTAQKCQDEDSTLYKLILLTQLLQKLLTPSPPKMQWDWMCMSPAKIELSFSFEFDLYKVFMIIFAKHVFNCIEFCTMIDKLIMQCIVKRQSFKFICNVFDSI